MSDFENLISSTFGEDGTIRIKYLEQTLRSLVAKLDSNNVNVSSNINPVSQQIPSPSSLGRAFRKNDVDNPVLDMLNEPKITKRVEALEINVQKMKTLLQTIHEKKKVEIVEIGDESKSELSHKTLIDNENFLIISDELINIYQNSNIDEMMSMENILSSQSDESESSSSQLFKIDNRKICCNDELLKSHSYQTFGFKKGTHLQEIPCIQTFPPFILNQFKPKLTDATNDDKCRVNLCDLQNHIIQNDAVNSIISQNQFFLQHQICEIQTALSDVHEQIKDVFFASEENDSKWREAIASMNDFNSKIFCLKSDVKDLRNDSRNFTQKFARMEDEFETLNSVKANIAYVDEKLLVQSKLLYSELKKFTPLEQFLDECDIVTLRMSIFNESLEKLEGDVKKALTCIQVRLDEKMCKDEIENFKTTVAYLFDDFLKELRLILFKMTEKSVASGTSKTLQPGLNCISCHSKVSTLTSSLNKIDYSAARFKLMVGRIKEPKKDSSSRITNICGSKKSDRAKMFKKKNQDNGITCHSKQSLLSFPNTQQCFIISKDNSIFKADALTCLKNLKL